MSAIVIKITIKEGELEELKEGFLKAVKRPDKYKDLTDIQFFKKWLEDNIINAYKTGKTIMAAETTTPTIIEDIIEVS